VNYNLVAIMMPQVLIGSFVGVIISNILPEAVLTIILVVLLFYLTYDSLSKAFGLWRKETAAMEREAYQSLPGGATEMSATAKGSGAPAVSASAVNMSSEIVEENMGSALTPADDLYTAQQIVKREGSNWLNWMTHLICTLLVTSAFAVNLIRGSAKNPSIVNLQKCGVVDWSIFWGFIVMACFLSYLSVQRVKEEDRIKRAVKVGVCKSDLVFDRATTTKVILGGIGGGLCSAVGLGGGVAFNPVLLGLGVPPQVSSSTGMYMIMFSSFSNVLTFWIFGNLAVNYSMWIGLWSGIGIYIFLSVIGGIIKKYRRPSLIVFFLGGVIAASSVVVPTVNINFLI
jgi:uncharacterized membrane protein YfcA